MGVAREVSVRYRVRLLAPWAAVGEAAALAAVVMVMAVPEPPTPRGTLVLHSIAPPQWLHVSGGAGCRATVLVVLLVLMLWLV